MLHIDVGNVALSRSVRAPKPAYDEGVGGEHDGYGQEEEGDGHEGVIQLLHGVSGDADFQFGVPSVQAGPGVKAYRLS